MTTYQNTHHAPSIRQHTLTQSEIWQAGSHGRRSDVLVVHPAAADSGIRFINQGTSGEFIHASWKSVVDAKGGVVLGNIHGDTLHGAVPLLAALRIAGIDNARVEIYGRNIPSQISDFDFYLNMLAQVGARAQPEARKLITINSTVEVREGNGCVSLSPATEFRAIINSELRQSNGYTNFVSTLLLSDHAEPTEQLIILRDETVSWNLLQPFHGIGRLPRTQLASVIEMVGHLALAAAPVSGFLRAHSAGPAHYQALLRAVMEHRTTAFTTVDAQRGNFNKKAPSAPQATNHESARQGGIK